MKLYMALAGSMLPQNDTGTALRNAIPLYHTYRGKALAFGA